MKDVLCKYEAHRLGVQVSGTQFDWTDTSSVLPAAPA